MVVMSSLKRLGKPENAGTRTRYLVYGTHVYVCVCWQRQHANSVASGNTLMPSVVVIYEHNRHFGGNYCFVSDCDNGSAL